MYKFSANIADAMRIALKGITHGVHSAGAGASSPSWLGIVAKVDAAQNAASFATEGDKSGEKWPDLLQGDGNFKAYKKWKRRNWPNKKLNVWRGDTRDSLIKNSSADRVVRKEGNVICLGTRAKLAKQMQEGQSYSKPMVVYLKEKSPVKTTRFKKTGSMTLTREGKNGKVRKRNVAIGVTKVSTRNWFTLFIKQVPPRPIVRKSPVQEHNLKLAISKGLVMHAARVAAGTPHGAVLAALAARIRPNATA